MTAQSSSSVRKRKHKHAEAFALMKYASRDGEGVEFIWNSRDGVTPFGVVARDGKTELLHVDWSNDVYAPDHRPALGDRIFVDLTESRARAAAHRNAERFWQEYPPARSMYDSPEEFAEALAKGYLAQPGAPDLVVVAG